MGQDRARDEARGRELISLPVDAHLPRIVNAVRRGRFVVVVAPPGSGKTTRIPPALVPDGKVILLQPRRLAARALARRIAEERGWTLGAAVGWQTRFDRRFDRTTQLLVATEGILTARLRSDPLLEEFRTVVLDEFHERSLHGDVGLALAHQAALARRDLRVVVMSATLDARAVARFLGDAEVVEIETRNYPVAIDHAPGVEPAAAVAAALARATTTSPDGAVLCFLPGAPEIRQLTRALSGRVAADLFPLHGSLDAGAQDAAVRATGRPRVVLATNLAETSLTVEGVREVVDTGLVKVLRRDAAVGIDRLEIERISRDAADQRAGRAGRTAPGRATRLWDPREELRPHREPEIARIDLARPLLEILAWGGDPLDFQWFEAPPSARMSEALRLLDQLGARRAGRITELGRAMAGYPVHPRLALVLESTRGARRAVAACAILAEGWRIDESLETSNSDLLVLGDRLARAPETVRRAAAELEQRVTGGPARGSADESRAEGEAALRLALFQAFPDRLARRREAGSSRLVLASGHGAVLDPKSGVRGAEFVVALELVAGARGPGSEALIRLASAVDRDWIEPTSVEVVHETDRESGSVRAFESERYFEIELSRRAVAPDPSTAERLLVELAGERGLDAENSAMLRRASFAGVAVDLEAWRSEICRGRTSLPTMDLVRGLPGETRVRIDRDAPDGWTTPSGRRVRLEYRDDDTVIAAVRLQDMFGVKESPRLGPRRVAVTFQLLAPNGRPVQTTRDLAGFWERTWPEVRKELRGRYPKHRWPEKP